jgi:hypothetical protein
MKNTTPRHRRPNSPEMQGAMRIIEEYRKSFAAHGILTPIHAPNLGVLADLIAGVEPVRPKVYTEAERDAVADLIGN